MLLPAVGKLFRHLHPTRIEYYELDAVIINIAFNPSVLAHSLSKANTCDKHVYGDLYVCEVLTFVAIEMPINFSRLPLEVFERKFHAEWSLLLLSSHIFW